MCKRPGDTNHRSKYMSLIKKPTIRITFIPFSMAEAAPPPPPPRDVYASNITDEDILDLPSDEVLLAHPYVHAPPSPKRQKSAPAPLYTLPRVMPAVKKPAAPTIQRPLSVSPVPYGGYRRTAAADATADFQNELRRLHATGDPEDTADAAEGLDEVQLEALHRVENGESLFITGRAGTGKSKLLRAIKLRCSRDLGKVVYMVAYTGVAAANIGGMTIHSCMGIGAAGKPPYYAGQDGSQRIQAMHILIIDEISFVPNHMLSGLDVLFRQIRGKHNLPFGGVQVIVCGDFHQLKPVDDKGKQDSMRTFGRAANGAGPQRKRHHSDDEALAKLYKEHLVAEDTPILYAFYAKCWMPMFREHFVWLRKVYRQKDDDQYLQILTEVRLGQPSRDTIRCLESRLAQNHFEIENGHFVIPDKYTVLYPTRKQAEEYNQKKIEALVNDNGYEYQAVDFAIHPSLKNMINTICLYPEKMTSRVGCRVLLKKNLSTAYGLVNGSCGFIIGHAEVYAIEKATELPRPVEGCIISRAVGADHLFGLKNSAYSVKYKVSYPAATTAEEEALSIEGTPADKNAVQFKEGAIMTCVCPRKAFDALCFDRQMSTEPSSSTTGLSHWALPDPLKASACRRGKMHPLPVVQFDNGQIIVVEPQLYVLEDESKSKKSKPRPAPGTEGISDGNAQNKLVIVSRFQIPLLVAFGITMHSSQGLTLRYLVLELGKRIFDDGQAYVALSRGQKLDSLILLGLDERSLRKVDAQVIKFYELLEGTEKKLEERQKKQQQELL